MLLKLIISTLYLLSCNSYLIWTPDSWRYKGNPSPSGLQPGVNGIEQMPVYSDIKELKLVEKKLSKCAPLVFAGECDNLQESLAKVSCGQSFLLMGGDCAESFDQFNTNTVRDTYRLILQMGMILTFGSGLPTIKIGRMAGQFAKPRSDEYETINGNKYLTYRGDIINGQSLDEREPDPKRMLEAYYQSVQTINILRAFSAGGYADISRIHSWNLNFVDKTEQGSEYRQFADQVTHTLKFINGLGISTKADQFKQTAFYTAHECLLLNYEQSLTRDDSRTLKTYDCSAHMLWLGERTRRLDSAHVEFMRGITNPIGIKISEKINPEELIQLVKTLNPSNTPGKVVIITRMGAEKLKIHLPKLIRVIQREALNVIWCCDPMHANTIKVLDGVKTRSFQAIKEEIIEFFRVHKKTGSIPGGLHLEMTGQDVTECIGGNINTIKENDLSQMYLSQCDPRLNSAQSLEISFLVSDLLKEI
jgi:3-deoxy-7-phosphoheptulonate synthase